MKLKSTLFAALACVCAMPMVAQDYSTAFDGYSHTRSDRKLYSITINSPFHGKQELGVKNEMMAETYLDFTAQVNQGETISFSLSHSYAWMHSYFYLDADKNGFVGKEIVDGVIEEGNDLIAYSYFNGKNSAGEKTESKVFDVIPSYTVPESLPMGLYRMRYKIDWDCVNPSNIDDPSQNAQGNGNVYVDFMVRVESPSAITTIAADELDGETKVFDFLGRPVANPTNGLYIVNGKKVVIRK